MSNVGAGDVVIFPTFQGFRSAVTAEVDAAGREGGSRFSSAFGTAAKAVGVGIAAAVGVAVTSIAAIGAKGLDRALNIQDAKAQLDGLGHSAESVDQIMQNALASVKGTAFGLDQAATLAATAVAAGVKPGQDLERTLKLTADAATIAKVPLSEMGDIFGKVASSGKLNTEVLNQFSQRGVPLLQFVAAQYGVTADEAADMVSRGEVDFAAFQQAIETNIAGAALKSGQTARGAFANIGAAFGRLGAMFTQSAVDSAPALFQSVAGAVDRAATALKPFAASLSERIGPAFAAIGAYIDQIDFDRIVAQVREFYLNAVDVKDLLLTGFTENETLLPESVVTTLQKVHDIATGLYNLIVNGDFSGALGRAFNIEEDNGVVDFVLTARQAIIDFFSSFSSSVSTGDLTGAFSSIGNSLSALQPAFASFAQEMPKIGQAAAQLAGAGLNAVVQVLSFLADNVGTIIQFMPLIVAGFFAWRAASAGVFLASSNLAALQLRMLPLTTANTFARLAAARAELQLAAATGTSTAAQSGGFLATIRSTAASVASVTAMVAVKAAQLAGAAATGIATAAQWAFNAALTANPIGLIIAAIVALVAGLIFFFTQTELGQQIWAEFTRFLTEAWTNIVAVATTVFTALGEFFTNVWNGIVAVVQFVWLVVYTIVSTYINLVLTIITTVINVVVAVWTAVWDTISGVIQAVWSFIVAFVTAYIATVRSVITNVVNGISNVWNSTWSAISGFFQEIWNGIVSFLVGVIVNIRNGVQGLVDGVRNTVEGVFEFIRSIPDRILGILGNLGNLLVNSGRALIDGFISGIKGAIGGVGDAIGGVLDFAAGFFPNSPAERGPFSGAGWRRIGRSGAAIMDEFSSGLGGAAVTVPIGPTFGGPGRAAVAGAGTGETIILQGVTDIEEAFRMVDKRKKRKIAASGAAFTGGVR